MDSPKDVNPFSNEIRAIGEFYPNSLVYDAKSNCLQGELGFHRPYRGRYVEDRYQLQIIFTKNCSEFPPTVKEIGDKIPRDSDHHVNPNDTLCLGSPLEILAKFTATPSLFAFVDSILVPYLFWHSYKNKYNGEEPWPMYSHGPDGIKEYRGEVELKERYFAIFKTKSLKVVLGLLKIIVDESYKGNPNCPCGRGKKLNNCHLSSIENLLNMTYLKVTHLAQDYWHLKDKHLSRRAK